MVSPYFERPLVRYPLDIHFHDRGGIEKVFEKKKMITQDCDLSYSRVSANLAFHKNAYALMFDGFENYFFKNHL